MRTIAALLLVAACGTLPADAAGQPIRGNDAQLAGDISAAINTYPHFTIFDDVSVTAEQGRITLSGRVTMPFKRDEIGKRAAGVDGVTSVANGITVLPASRFDDELRQRIARSIYGDANFWNYGIMPNPTIHIIVEHGHVTLTGVVRSRVDRALAGALADQFGVRSVTNVLQTDADVRGTLEKTD